MKVNYAVFVTLRGAPEAIAEIKASLSSEINVAKVFSDAETKQREVDVLKSNFNTINKKARFSQNMKDKEKFVFSLISEHDFFDIFLDWMIRQKDNIDFIYEEIQSPVRKMIYTNTLIRVKYTIDFFIEKKDFYNPIVRKINEFLDINCFYHDFAPERCIRRRDVTLKTANVITKELRLSSLKDLEKISFYDEKTKFKVDYAEVVKLVTDKK